MLLLRSRTLTWVALMALALIGLGLGGALLARRTLPQISGTARLPSLHGPVTVARDRWGVPHIYAGDEHDLFAAQGYVTAQDRLWQMLLRRQAARGQLSDWLGPRAAQADNTLGSAGFYTQAESTLSLLDAETRVALDAYALGVNECLGTCPEPIELLTSRSKARPVEPWTPTDSLALVQMLQWAQSQSADVGLQEALSAHLGAARATELMVTDAPAGPTPPIDPAVRQALRWAGLPLMRGDPPAVASAPGLPAAWYMATLRSENGGTAGATWPGVPGMLIDQTAVISRSSSLREDARALTQALLALPPQGWLQVRVHGMLRQWDYDLSGKTRLGNASSAVYEVWVWHLARDTFQAELGPDLFARYWAAGFAPHALAGLAAKPDTAWNETMRRAYAEALEDLGRHYGDLHTIWEWDTMHAAQLRHPLGDVWWLNRTVKFGGDAPFDPGQPDDPLNAYAPVLIPSLRIDDQGFALAGGQSGHVFSPHYADLVPLWARGQSVALQDAARSQDLKDVEGVLMLTP
jgi:acyl-homoserine lactone acylase PvdQ